MPSGISSRSFQTRIRVIRRQRDAGILPVSLRWHEDWGLSAMINNVADAVFEVLETKRHEHNLGPGPIISGQRRA